jgi:hypothetical protein
LVTETTLYYDARSEKHQIKIKLLKFVDIMKKRLALRCRGACPNIYHSAFNGPGYLTCLQEYGVNFVVFMEVSVVSAREQ